MFSGENFNMSKILENFQMPNMFVCFIVLKICACICHWNLTSFAYFCSYKNLIAILKALA